MRIYTCRLLGRSILRCCHHWRMLVWQSESWRLLRMYGMETGHWRLRRKMEIKSHLQRGIRTEMKAGMDMRRGTRNIPGLWEWRYEREICCTFLLFGESTFHFLKGMLIGPGTIRFHSHVQKRAFVVRSIIGKFHSFAARSYWGQLGMIWISKETFTLCATLWGALW